MTRAAALAAATAAVLLASAPARAEEPLAANVVYLELGGPCVLGSLNYERAFHDLLRVRAGLGWIPNIDPFADGKPHVIEQVVTAGTLMGGTKIMIEIALGFVVGEPTDGGRWGVYATGVLGLRYHGESGTVFRAGATPVFELRDGSGGLSRLFTPMFGLSFGHSW
jgi:hypothetical protein